MKKGNITKTEDETAWLISSLENPDPDQVLALYRAHWRIEIMHRDKDVILGDGQYTNRLDHAPRNIFTLLSATRTVLKDIDKSLTTAIEMVQDNRNKVIRILTNADSNLKCDTLPHSSEGAVRSEMSAGCFAIEPLKVRSSLEAQPGIVLRRSSDGSVWA